MKKRFIWAVLCCVLAVSMLAGCTSTQSGTDVPDVSEPGAESSDVSQQAPETEITLEELYQANDFDQSTLQAHNTLHFEQLHYNDQGEVFYVSNLIINVGINGYVTLDEANEMDGAETIWNSVTYTEGDAGYGQSDGTLFQRCFLDGQVDQYLEDFQARLFTLEGDLEELIIDQRIEDGLLTITTRVPLNETSREWVLQTDLEEYSELEYVYQADPETLELQFRKINAISDAQTMLLEESSYTYSDEQLLPPDFVEQLKNPDSFRTVTIHDREEVVSFTIAEEASLLLASPEGYGVFEDAAGRIPIQAGSPTGGDREVYIVSLSEAGSQPPIQPGVWLAYGAGEYTYYFFNEDGESGSTASLQTGTGVAFVYELEGQDAVFYMGAEDAAAPAVLDWPEEDSLIIRWSEGIEEELTYVSSQDANSFQFYSNDELCQMALEYYAGLFGSAPEFAEAMTNEDGTVTIQLYDNLGDRNSTAAWYTVDRFTAAGTDEQDQPVELQ